MYQKSSKTSLKSTLLVVFDAVKIRVFMTFLNAGISKDIFVTLAHGP